MISTEKESQTDTLTIIHSLNPSEEGTYAICLDHRDSRFIPVFVEFDIRRAPRPEPLVISIIIIIKMIKKKIINCNH